MVLVEDTKSRIKKLRWLCSYSVVCRERNGCEQSPMDCHRVGLQELSSVPLCVALSCVPQGRDTGHSEHWAQPSFPLEEVCVCYGPTR